MPNPFDCCFRSKDKKKSLSRENSTGSSEKSSSRSIGDRERRWRDSSSSALDATTSSPFAPHMLEPTDWQGRNIGTTTFSESQLQTMGCTTRKKLGSSTEMLSDRAIEMRRHEHNNADDNRPSMETNLKKMDFTIETWRNHTQDGVIPTSQTQDTFYQNIVELMESVNQDAGQSHRRPMDGNIHKTLVEKTRALLEIKKAIETMRQANRGDRSTT